MNKILYEKRNAAPVTPESPHYPFYCALKEGGKVWRDDRHNNVREWLTLDHPGIQGNPGNVAYFGYENLSLDTYPKQIDVCDGKYTVIYDMDTGRAECLRNGQPWRSLVGDKMVLALFDEIVALREENARLKAAAASPTDEADAPPARPRP